MNVRTIQEIEVDMKVLIEQIDGEDAAEEVSVEYIPYETNMKKLLNANDIEEYLLKHGEMCKQQNAVLECFDFKDTQSLQTYIEENEVDMLSLQTETVKATCEALKFLIYEAEDEEY